MRNDTCVLLDCRLGCGPVMRTHRNGQGSDSQGGPGGRWRWGHLRQSSRCERVPPRPPSHREQVPPRPGPGTSSPRPTGCRGALPLLIPAEGPAPLASPCAPSSRGDCPMAPRVEGVIAPGHAFAGHPGAPQGRYCGSGTDPPAFRPDPSPPPPCGMPQPLDGSRRPWRQARPRAGMPLPEGRSSPCGRAETPLASGPADAADLPGGHPPPLRSVRGSTRARPSSSTTPERSSAARQTSRPRPPRRPPARHPPTAPNDEGRRPHKGRRPPTTQAVPTSRACAAPCGGCRRCGSSRPRPGYRCARWW